MALTGLLQDLQPQHHWRLQLWHGDHGWRAESAEQATSLAAWAAQRGLPLWLERAAPGEAGPTEERARQWRYHQLIAAAHQLACRHVVTGHTASDRAETVLLNLARGSHQRGLASLRASRPLAAGIALVRPLLIFSRDDTGRICQEHNLPIWLDPSNAESEFSRNRLRQEVIPVLEQLHPGASRRISRQAARLAEEQEGADQIIELALQALMAAEGGLNRRALAQLTEANRGRLLHVWLDQQLKRSLAAETVDQLVARLAPGREPGRQDLANGWQLHWDRLRLWLKHVDVANG
jgi:tRNA(Ile)-lysidine synthase